MWGRRKRRTVRGFATSPPVVTERLVIRAAMPPDMDGVDTAIRSEPPERVVWGDDFPQLMQRIVGLGAGAKVMKVICARGSGTVVGLLWERSAEQLAHDRVMLALWTASAYDADGYFEEVLAVYVPWLHGRGFRSVCCEVVAEVEHEQRMLAAAGFEHIDSVQRTKPDGSPVMAAVYEHRGSPPDQSV